MSLDLDAWGNEFLVRVKPMVHAAITDLVAGRPATDIAGVGLYTDADAVSVVAAVNTRQHLDRLRSAQPAYAEYYRWSPGEWDLTTVALVERGGADALAGSIAELDRVSDVVVGGGAGADTMEEFRHIVWEILVTALGQLLEDGSFDVYEDAIQAFAPMDEAIAPETLREWMAEINTDEAAAEYAAWLAAQL